MLVSQDQATGQSEGRWTEWLLRSFALMVYGFGVARLGYAWTLDQSRWTIIALLVGEGYTLLLILFARRASVRDMSPVVILATGYSMCYFLLIETAGTTRFIPELAGVALQVMGFAWQMASKVTLGRSFGLLPAQRGIVMSGPYRVVRHPIYMGYLIGHIGFLLVNFSWLNLLVLVLLYGATVLRILREEAVLSLAEDYRAYKARVTRRLVPFVF